MNNPLFFDLHNYHNNDNYCEHVLEISKNPYEYGWPICDLCHISIEIDNDNVVCYHCNKCGEYDLCEKCYKHEKNECSETCEHCAKHKCTHNYKFLLDIIDSEIVKDKLLKYPCETSACQECKKITAKITLSTDKYYYCETCDNLICLECYMLYSVNKNKLNNCILQMFKSGMYACIYFNWLIIYNLLIIICFCNIKKWFFVF